MAYVGNPIDTTNTFQSLVGKRFNGDGSTTAFTLDVAPGNVLDIEVFVGNVRQDPNSAYTLSGTTLTFTGAPPSGTNNIYVVHQAKSVGTIDVPSSFLSTEQTFTGGLDINGTELKLDAELYDVNGDFNTSTNTFTAPVSGVYMVTAAWQFVEDLNSNITDVAMKLNASNGDEFVKFENPQALQVSTGSEFKYYANGSKIIYMDANDTMYLEIDAYSGGSHTFKLNGGSNQRAETSMQIYLLG